MQEQGYTWNDAYGKFLGTNMVCSFATTIVSFFPTAWLRRLFPTWIAGLTVFLVGVNLIGVAGISVRPIALCSVAFLVYGGEDGYKNPQTYLRLG